MASGSRYSGRCICVKNANCRQYSKNPNRLSWLGLEKRTFPACLISLLFLLTSFEAAAQTPATPAALPLASAAETSQQKYTISAQELRVPAKARMHLKLAHERFSKLDFAGAQKEIDQALKVDSGCAPAFSKQAVLRLASRDFDRAIEDAAHALALDPGDASAYLALATAYNSVSEFQKAEAAAQQALGIRPDFWQGKLEMAKALYGEGRFVPALRELDELGKDFPDVHLVRANTLVRLNRGEEASSEFRLFLKEAPEDRRSEQVRGIVARTAQRVMPSCCSLTRP